MQQYIEPIVSETRLLVETKCFRHTSLEFISYRYHMRAIGPTNRRQ